jgi:hypothetical protein
MASRGLNKEQQDSDTELNNNYINPYPANVEKIDS